MFYTTTPPFGHPFLERRGIITRWKPSTFYFSILNFQFSIFNSQFSISYFPGCPIPPPPWLALLSNSIFPKRNVMPALMVRLMDFEVEVYW